MQRNWHRSIASVVTGLAIAVACATAHPGHAAAQSEVDEPWFVVVDAMLTGPINERTMDQFSVGGMGAIGVYRSFLPELAFGLRLGGGALTEGEIIPQDPVDRGWLGLGQLSASMRVRPFGRFANQGRRASGLWVQLGAGPWLVDGEIVPAFDVGLGYGLELGPVVISPMGQFTHVVETEGRFGEDHVLMWNGGLEVAFLDEVSVQPGERVRAKPESEPLGAPLAEIEREEPEPEAIGAAPLPAEEDVAQPFVNDQLVIDERVFFDYDRWQIRRTGREQLDEVVRRYEESGDRWEALVVSGHADRRGPLGYNEDLSRKRADAVREYLVDRGVPVEILEIEAWGETRPAIPDAQSEWEHQVNRRVQFEIVWRPGMRPEGEAPEPSPTLPDYVDPAPPDRRGLE